MRIALCLCSVLLLTGSFAAALAPDMEQASEVEGGYDVTLQVPVRGPGQAVLLDWSDGQALTITFDQKATTVRSGAAVLATWPALQPGAVRIKRRLPLVELQAPGQVYRTYCRRPIAGVAAPATTAGFESFSVQPVGLVEFHDDFFDPDGVASMWEPLSGKWTVGTYRDPLKAIENRPIAASWYQCDGGGLAVTGEAFWDSYRVRVAALAQADVSSGLVFCHGGEGNMGLLRVTPKPDGQGLAELLENGKVVAKATVPWPVGNWQELAVEACGGRLTAFVRGLPVGTYPTSRLGGGRVGVYAEGAGQARFDDFTVSPVQRVQMRPDWREDCWQSRGGVWGTSKGGPTGSAASFAVTEHVTDYTPDLVKADVVPETSSAGVVLNWRDNSGYSLLIGPDAKYRVCRVDDGKETVLLTGEAPREPSFSLQLSHYDGRLEASVGEVRQVAYDFSHSAGAAGCGVAGTARFDQFTAGLEPQEPTHISTVTGVPTPMPGENDDSRRFVLGYIWQALGGNWNGTGPADDRRLTGKPYGSQPAALWYSQLCPGDAVMQVEELQLAVGARAGLAINCERRDVNSGYRAEADGGTLKLYRADQLMAEAALTAVPEDLRLWRDGRHVVACAGERGVSFADPEPLSGSLCAAYATGAGLSSRQITLSHRRASYYTFKSEETDWQPVSGEWMTHSGMACIPWDYWLTAKGAPQSLAFHLRPQLDLQHLDLWIAEYSEGYEDLEHKHFPLHDISLVLNADRAELDGGYRFLIAAQNGSVTQLLRQGKVVAETRDPGCAVRFGGHCNAPREIHAVIGRDGPRLTLHLNGRPAIDWTDPEPLPPGMLGLGTTGCTANFRDLWFVER